MRSKGESVFFRVCESGPERVLYPGIVENAEGDLLVIRLEEATDRVEESVEGFVHYERNREFMQQSARVVRKDSDDPPVFAVELRGAPVSAESRQTYRVSCLVSDVMATFDEERECEVLDVSATGFGLYTRSSYSVGQRVSATLHYGDAAYSGLVTVQSIRQLGPRKVRVGVHAGEAHSELARSLPAINLAIQREQLRRISGDS